MSQSKKKPLFILWLVAGALMAVLGGVGLITAVYGLFRYPIWKPSNYSGDPAWAIMAAIIIGIPSFILFAGGALPWILFIAKRRRERPPDPLPRSGLIKPGKGGQI